MRTARVSLFLLVVCLLTPPVVAVSVIRVPQDAATIQAAVDRAQPGDVILVRPGLYLEAVIIRTSGISLIADVPDDHIFRGPDERVILDGEMTRTRLIRVRGEPGAPVSDVVIRGFWLRRFKDRGISLENTQECRVENNEASDGAPLPDFSAGMWLDNSSFTTVAGNYFHDTTMFGLGIGGSHFNIVRGNLFLRIHDRQPQPTGCGISTWNASRNVIIQNRFEFNGWGILFQSDRTPSTANLVQENTLHSNYLRAIEIDEPNNGNWVLNNNATGNSIQHRGPPGRFDLWDVGEMNNVWQGNQAYSPFTPR